MTVINIKDLEKYYSSVKALDGDKEEAIEAISAQVLSLNPDAESKKVLKFIRS